MVNSLAIFIDTGIFVAARNIRDINHERAKYLLEKGVEGAWGDLYTSTFIVDEAVTLALVRTKSPEVAIDIGSFILESGAFVVLYINERILEHAWELFKTYSRRRMSFTDATTIALMREYGIEHVMSFDKHFDGVVSRIY